MNASRDVVLVTGANGLLGLHTARSLARHYLVVGTARHDPQPPIPFEVVRMDVTSDESVESALRQVRERHGSHIASVLHFVAYYSFSGEHSTKYDQITVRGRNGSCVRCTTKASMWSSSSSPAPCSSTGHAVRASASLKTGRLRPVGLP